MSPEAKPPEFTIVRTFDAPRELVWRAWTEDTELAQWLRPFGVITDSVSFDVRVGGVYTYTMTNDETDEKFPTGGQFLEVEPMDRLVFTWGEPAASVETTPVITLTFNEKALALSSLSTCADTTESPVTDSSMTGGMKRSQTSSGT